jgi:glycosyltransferase involved in cell wall biosynthesis
MTEQLKSLSIITINLNNREGLRKTIESVIAQTFKKIQYIIIDGGSTDGSVDVIKEYADNINYWVSETDNGYANAHNKGIKQSTGDYLLFLNSGDYLSETTVLSDAFKYSFDEEIIYGDLYFETAGADFVLKEYPSKLTFDFFFSHNESLPHPSSFIKKSLFLKVGLYGEKLKIVNDWEFWMKAIFLHQATYKRIPVAISVFNTEGMSSQFQNQKLLKSERDEVFEKYFSGFVDDYRKFYAEIADINSRFNAERAAINSNIFIKILRKLQLLRYESIT